MKRAIPAFLADAGTRVAAAAVAFYVLAAAMAWLGLTDGAASAISDTGYAGPTPAHWLGTNRLGQDVLARTVAGAGEAVATGFAVALGASLLGAVLGALAGLRGGRADLALNQAAGIVDAVPVYLVAGGVAATGSPAALPLALIAMFWTSTARLVRAEVLRVRRLPFVDAARAAGATPSAIARRHVLPHCAPVILAQGGSAFVAAVKTEAILSFLGLGAQSATSWGGMLAQAAQEIGGGHLQNFLAASVAFAGLVLAVNVLTDRAQRVLDPRAMSSDV